MLATKRGFQDNGRSRPGYPVQRRDGVQQSIQLDGGFGCQDGNHVVFAADGVHCRHLGELSQPRVSDSRERLVNFYQHVGL